MTAVTWPARLESGHCQGCRSWLTVAGRQYSRSGFCQLNPRMHENGKGERYEVFDVKRFDEQCDQWSA